MIPMIAADVVPVERVPLRFKSMARGVRSIGSLCLLMHFEWLFGDAETAQGRVIRHTLNDVQGALLDGSRRFRVLLHVTGANGGQSWTVQPVEMSAVLRTGEHRLRLTGTGAASAVVIWQSPGVQRQVLASRASIEEQR
jgi:hypothetical protein